MQSHNKCYSIYISAWTQIEHINFVELAKMYHNNYFYFFESFSIRNPLSITQVSLENDLQELFQR